jgi:hypothetical protein
MDSDTTLMMAQAMIIGEENPSSRSNRSSRICSAPKPNTTRINPK